MKILYLYTEVMGYLIPVFEELVKTYGAQIDVIHWDKQKLTPYIPPSVQGVRFHGRADLSDTQLVQLAQDLAPDLTYISGWQDKGYLKAARKLKALGCPIVVGFDDQWHGTLRQFAGSYLMRLFWKRRYFTYAWVAGPYQFEYASRMGFKKSNIIFNILTCDVAAFSSLASQKKIGQEAPNFLYLGRYHPNKDLGCLLEAYKIYRSLKGTWGLTLAGNGPLKNRLEQGEGIEIKEFQSTEGVRALIMRSSGFILPSRKEQWGVVVQEAAVAGLPLILSDRVGSRPVFLVDGDNGYTFTCGSPYELAQKMLKISNLDHETLARMGIKSHALGITITPQKSAASLVSILQNKTSSAL